MPHAVPGAIETLIDEGSFEPSGDALPVADPLSFPGYRDALERAQATSGSAESVVTGPARIGDMAVEVAWFDFSFMGGSLGSRTGELLARALERSARRGVPFVLRTATGGARMQEGVTSLVQMPKVVAARLELAAAHQPFVAVLGHPTTGAVLASLAGLADVTVAEDGATIGFAGPRVVEAATKRRLSPDSHTAATAFAAGLVDAVAARDHARGVVASALAILTAPEPATTAPPIEPPAPRGGDGRGTVATVRSPGWPRAPELARALAGSFFELRGDRAQGDDEAIVAGFGKLDGRTLVLVGQQ
ncbi:MAG: acetyl-CoA carboxylase carboxyl transferase subunit beta, partial [Actinomycetota bacterium]|nr:acetyl-CoA carboxylase carboxyl transferase subunit beta [Actinomycetota bacterium]